MSNTFAKANQLWFREGRTQAALAAYEEALRETPSDPVLAFQLARVLWSLDRFERARSLLEQAAMHRENLSASAQGVVEMWKGMLEQLPSERPFPELPPALLDRDRLEAGNLPVGDWRTIADAAAGRRMFGLAAYALSQWDGAPLDAEDAKEIDHIETNRLIEENMLAQMYANSEPSQEAFEDQEPIADNSVVQQPSEVVSPSQTARRPAMHSAPTEMPDLPTLPLRLDVRVTPAQGPVGVPTTMIASLSNPTGEPQIVNRRMLLNHLRAPGEIWLDVDGPEGYRNNCGFRVRAGAAPNEFFVSLAPGEFVEQSWNLNDYQSLHIPGDYDITVTYHNEASQAPDGRPTAVGKATGSVRIHRY